MFSVRFIREIVEILSFSVSSYVRETATEKNCIVVFSSLLLMKNYQFLKKCRRVCLPSGHRHQSHRAARTHAAQNNMSFNVVLIEKDRMFCSLSFSFAFYFTSSSQIRFSFHVYLWLYVYVYTSKTEEKMVPCCRCLYIWIEIASRKLKTEHTIKVK